MQVVKQYSIFMLIALIMSVILVMLSGVILSTTNLSDNSMTAFVLSSVGFSVFLCSMLLNKKIKQKGYIYGGIFSLIYFLLIYIFTVVSFAGFFVNTAMLMYLGVVMLAGIIGGMIGVNL